MVQAAISEFQVMMARAREEEKEFRKVLIAWMKQHDPGFSEFYSEWSIQHPTSQFAEPTSFGSSDISSVSDPASPSVLDSSSNFPVTRGPVILGEVGCNCNNTPPIIPPKLSSFLPLPTTEETTERTVRLISNQGDMKEKCTRSSTIGDYHGYHSTYQIASDFGSVSEPTGNISSVSDSSVISPISEDFVQFSRTNSNSNCVGAGKILPSIVNINELSNFHGFDPGPTIKKSDAEEMLRSSICNDSQSRFLYQYSNGLGDFSPIDQAPTLGQINHKGFSVFNATDKPFLRQSEQNCETTFFRKTGMSVSELGQFFHQGIRPLTHAEWKERRKKGRCFYAGLQVGPAHKAHKGNLRVLLSVEDELGKETANRYGWDDIPVPRGHLSVTVSKVPSKTLEFFGVVTDSRSGGVAAQLDEGKGLSYTVANFKEADKRVALYFAAREGKTEACKLEELKLDVHTKDEDGETLLIHAVKQGYNSTEYGAIIALSSELVTINLDQVDGTVNISLMEDLLSIGVEVDPHGDAGTLLVWADGHGQQALAACSLPYLDVLIQVLGMEWLTSLGKVTHKWDRAWMEIMHNGIVVHIQQLITGQQLQAKVEQGLVMHQGAFRFTLKQLKELTKEEQEGDERLKLKQLKVHSGLQMLPPDLEISVAYELIFMVILATHLIKYHWDQIHQWLIRWKGGTIGDNTRDDVLAINNQDFEASLEDKTFLMAGVVIGIENSGSRCHLCNYLTHALSRS